jgi:ABC-type branched-subunit amino acid transport system substrate-binding protein
VGNGTFVGATLICGSALDLRKVLAMIRSTKLSDNLTARIARGVGTDGTTNSLDQLGGSMDRRGVRVVALGAVLALTTGLLAGTASARTKHQDSGGEKTEIIIAALGPFFDATTGTESSEWPAAVKARVKAANKAKELGPDVTLKVLECDTGLDPNDTEACARDAIEQGAVASVGFNGTTGANLLPILEGAGIPAIGTVPVSPNETTSPVSFPFTSGVPGAFEALPIALGEKDATSQGLVLTDLGAATATAQLFVDDSVARQGYTLAEPVTVAPDQTDFAPIVASATAGDPEGLNVFIIGEAAATFIRQLRQGGYEGVLSSGSPFLTGSVIEALGDDANGIQVPSLLRWQKSAGGKQYLKEMKKYAKGEATTDLGSNYWLSTWVTIDLLAKIIDEGGTPDAASLLAAAGALEDYDTQGMTPPITTTASPEVDLPIPLERFYNPTVFMFEIKKGKVVETGKDFINPFEKQ